MSNKTILQHCKLNDRVNLFTDANDTLRHLSIDDDTYTSPCTIIKIGNSGNIYVGWLATDKIPIPALGVPIYRDSSFAGYVAWMECSASRRCSLITSSIEEVLTTTQLIINIPCRQCKRNNSPMDINCWWCNVSNPTNSSMIGP